MNRRNILIIIALMALIGSVAAWTQTSSSLATGITAGGDGGKVVTSLTAVGENFSITKGKAQKIAGVELYKIELGNAQFSNLLRMNVILTNTDEMGKVLNNPNAFIEVSVYYPDPAGTTVLDGGVDNGTHVTKDTAAKATVMLTRTSGDVFLYPSVTGQTTLYILASINTPGTNPKGQVEQLDNLRFYISIDIRSAAE